MFKYRSQASKAKHDSRGLQNVWWSDTSPHLLIHGVLCKPRPGKRSAERASSLRPQPTSLYAFNWSCKAPGSTERLGPSFHAAGRKTLNTYQDSEAIRKNLPNLITQLNVRCGAGNTGMSKTIDLADLCSIRRSWFMSQILL